MIKVGKREIGRIVKVLEAEHATVEDAAQAVLDETLKVIESRSKYLVFAILRHPTPKSPDEDSSLVVLGPYSTAGDVKAAGESLAVGHASGYEYRWWSVEGWTGTPGAYHADVKARRTEAEDASKGPTHADRVLECAREHGLLP